MSRSIDFGRILGILRSIVVLLVRKTNVRDGLQVSDTPARITTKDANHDLPIGMYSSLNLEDF